MFVADIKDDLQSAQCLGRCADALFYRRVTDGVALLSNKSQWDSTVAMMDICACDGCVTLPNDVGSILAINVGGYPTLVKDQWAQFHLNGAGSMSPWRVNDVLELGQVCTWRDPSKPVWLAAVVENPADANKALRVYGWDTDGKRIYEAGQNGALQDGFYVPTIYGYPVPTNQYPAIARIDRIEIAGGRTGFIKLVAIDPDDDTTHTVIGYYEPWETNPTYRRIKVGNHAWIRLKYKRKRRELVTDRDWIPLDNRECIILAVKAVNLRLNGHMDEARKCEIEATRILQEQQASDQPAGALTGPQIIMGTDYSQCGKDTLFY